MEESIFEAFGAGSLELGDMTSGSPMKKPLQVQAHASR